MDTLVSRIESNSLVNLKSHRDAFRNGAVKTTCFSRSWPVVKFTVRTRPSLNLRKRANVSCEAGTIGASEIELPTSLGDPKELSEAEKFALGFSSTVRTIISVAIVAGAAGVGYAAGGKVNDELGPLAGAVVLGAAGVGAATVLNSAGREGSVKEVFNTLVTSNPSTLGKSDVTAVSERFGVALDDERVIQELRELYDRYISQVLPQGNEPLKGHEVDTIIKFKNALQIEDEVAAPVHIELGRRMIRQRLEAGNKESSLAERKSFQKLVFVSNLVFGEKSKFLLPWKRVFKVTDAQVEIAISDNAKILLETAITESEADADLEKLKELRRLQLKFKVSDEVAEELFVKKSRGRLEAIVDEALQHAKARIKNIPQAVVSVEESLKYSLALGSLSKESDIIPGVTAVTLSGGKFSADRDINDLKVLYGIYLEDAISAGRFSDEKEETLGKIKNLFGLGTKEAESVVLEISSKVYRRQLAQAVKSGELEKAESQAAYIEELCENLKFDFEDAFKIHEDIYRQKLENCLKDNALDDEDVKGLTKLTELLCIPQDVVDKVHSEVCGRIFGKIVDEAIAGGVGGYDPLLQDGVRKAIRGLRLTFKAALEIVSQKVKTAFQSYVKRARSTPDSVEAGRELRKLVLFSNLTVSQILDDVRIGCGLPVEPAPEPVKLPEAPKEPEDEKAKAMEEKLEMMEKIYKEEFGDMGQSFRKTTPKKAVKELSDGKPQREITLRGEIDVKDALDVYEKFLLYAMQGEQVQLTYGMKVRVQRDQKDLVRLHQLGDILGLQPTDIMVVQQRLAEKAFKTQAESLLADGQLSPKRAEQLKDLQKQVGLADASAEKIIKQITSGKMAGAIAKSVQMGQFSINDIRGLKDAGLKIENLVTKPARVQLFKKLISEQLASGTGQFDEELITKTIPEDLALSVEEAQSLLKAAASDKVKDALVQAISMLRQKQKDKVLIHVNNLISANKASSQQGPLSWAVKEELLDLYALYISQPNANENDELRLRNLLDIDESTAEGLKDMVEKGGFSIVDANKEEDFVF